jgi:hypothetical protein
MEKSANERTTTMKKLGLIFFLMTFLGCSTAQFPYYIQADHPYIRKISGNYDKIITAVKGVFYQEGLAIVDEVNPSEYERHEGGEDQKDDILFFTEIKHHSRILYSTYTHWNVFVHKTADGAEIDLRYEALTPHSIKQSSKRNDQLAAKLLDEIEQSIESK